MIDIDHIISANQAPRRVAENAPAQPPAEAATDGSVR